jgi:SSS family solute:Na+ symporter
MPEPASLRPLDLIVIFIYAAAMVWMGLYFSRRNKSTSDYFLGGRRLPAWVIGLSMLGTSISSVTFLAFPAAAFALDWRQVVPNLMLPFVAVFAIWFFIPFFRRGNLTSAFEYLEDRFGPLVRLYGAISFIILQLVRVGTVLYLMSIPTGLLLGVPIEWVIIIGGIVVAVYTVVGGMAAVMWTDAVQTFIFLGGGVMCLFIVAFGLPNGFADIFTIGMEHGKFGLGPMHWNLSERTFPTMTILGITWWLGGYAGDQNMIQRYASASSLKEARRATAISSIMSVPTWVFFFFLGTSIYVYFTVNPDPHVGALEADQVFPYFIISRIPAGLSGLVIAAILSAGMSTLTSNLNAIATVSVVDLTKRYLTPGRDDKYYLIQAKVFTSISSVLMIIGAFIFSNMPKESMVDLSIIIGALFGGCLLGIFMLGFLTTRVNYTATLIALVAAIIFNVYLLLNSFGRLPEFMSLNVHDYWVSVLVNLLFVFIAMAISYCSPREHRDLHRLTVWTSTFHEDAVEPATSTTVLPNVSPEEG